MIDIEYIFQKKLVVLLMKQQYQMTINDKLWNTGKAVKQDQNHLKELDKGSKRLHRYGNYDGGRITSGQVVHWRKESLFMILILLDGLLEHKNLKLVGKKIQIIAIFLLRLRHQEVFLPNCGPRSILLLDSWSGHCPDIVEDTRPDSIIDFIILTIPASTTGQIQPLDVYGFRLWKNFIKLFSDTIMLLDLDINLHARNNILKLQSLTYHQFSSPRFQNLFKYAWFKSGYLQNRPTEFQTPVEYCFKSNAKVKCDICGEMAIITCVTSRECT
ncbi:hypothetical protein X777_01871, partial [Ooceraea biroi]